MQFTLTDDDEIGVQRTENKVFIRSASTYHPEFCTKIALCGHFLEAPANMAGRNFVGRSLRGARGTDRLLANHLVIGAMLRATCSYHINPGNVRTALLRKPGRLVGPLRPFRCRLDKDLN